MAKRVSTTLANARRLAVTKQHLSRNPPSKPTAENILDLFRDLGCVQLDPISAVAPSHLIVLWSRLGNFDEAQLDRLLWEDRKIFEYWAHQASLVLMEDYPLYSSMMRGFPGAFAKPWGPGWAKRNQEWMAKHSALKSKVLSELKQKGPLLSRQFEDKSLVKRRGSGWGSSSDASRMLSNLFFRGLVMVVGRQGNQKLWDLSEKFLPRGVSRKELSPDQVEHIAVQRSIKALGVANGSEIAYHFLRGRYRNLKATIKRLLDESKIYRVEIEGGPVGTGERYIHENDLPLLKEIESNEWRPRTTLLSPFDNLICDRTRTKLLFNFDYTVEIYTPPHKRKYGYYVLPILHGDRLIGRIDPLMNRKNGRLEIKAVHAETKAPKSDEVSAEIRNAIHDLSRFLHAKEVIFSRRVPRFWRSALR